MIVVVSLFAGLLAAFALVAGPFAGGGEHEITGAIPLGLSCGWALFALLSAGFTDPPQRWAAVPAAALAVTGAALMVLAPVAAAPSTLAWVWPSPLLALVVWMTAHARRGAGAPFVRDVAEMPAELNRAAKLTSLGDRPLAVVTAGKGYAAGWPTQHNNLAALSTNSSTAPSPARHTRRSSTTATTPPSRAGPSATL